MQKDKSFLITFLLLFIQLSVFGQDLTLSGTISDADTNEPLPGATVVIEGTNTGAISDFDGSITNNFPFQLEERSALLHKGHSFPEISNLQFLQAFFFAAILFFLLVLQPF